MIENKAKGRIVSAELGIGITAEKMAQFYGPDWHVFREPHFCPHCTADLRDHEHGPPFKREIGIIESDRCVMLLCPDCRKDLELAK